MIQRDSLAATYACDRCGVEAPSASVIELERQGWHEAYGAAYLCPECRRAPEPFGRWDAGRHEARRAADEPDA